MVAEEGSLQEPYILENFSVLFTDVAKYPQRYPHNFIHRMPLADLSLHIGSQAFHASGKWQQPASGLFERLENVPL